MAAAPKPAAAPTVKRDDAKAPARSEASLAAGAKEDPTRASGQSGKSLKTSSAPDADLEKVTPSVAEKPEKEKEKIVKERDMLRYKMIMEEEKMDAALDDDKFDGLDITNDDLDPVELRGTLYIELVLTETEMLSTWKAELDPQTLSAISKGIDLRQYNREVEQELSTIERDSVEDYLKEMDNFSTLHEQIQSCDSILEVMENLLRGFQADLGNISDEIKILQDKSGMLSIQLNNRKDLSGHLSQFVTGFMVSKPFIQYVAYTLEICDAEVNETYLQYLVELHKKIQFVTGKSDDIAAKKDVEPELEKLKLKAVAKIREFLLNKVYSLRKPKTNVQIIQQNILIKYKYLTRFLIKYSPETALELRDAYTSTLGAFYATNMRTYLTNLMKLQNEGTAKGDLIGADDKPTSSFWGGTSRKATGNIFLLGARDKVLSDGDKVRVCAMLELTQDLKMLIVPHEAMEKNLRFPFEVLFRSMMQLLIDTISPEHEFDTEFFAKMDLFAAIFDKTLAVYIEFYEAFLRESYDSVAIHLCIQIINRCKEQMTTRKISVLNAYFEKMLDSSWSRLKAVLELNIDSIRKVNPKDAPLSELRIHPVTKRYSELLLSLYIISGKTLDPRLHPYLNAMRSASAALILKFAAEVANKKMRIVFLINTYDAIIQALRDREKEIPTNDDIGFFDGLLQKQLPLFVNEQLTQYYPRLVQVAVELEAGKDKISRDALDAVTRDLAQSWKEKTIAQINKEIMAQYFQNAMTGALLLRSIFLKLRAMYTQFEEQLKRFYATLPAEFVPTNMVNYEIEKLLQHASTLV